MRYGFLFAGYSTDRSAVVVAWESIVMMRKLAVTLVGSTITDPYIQILAALFILVISFGLTAFVQPYEITLLNSLDVGGLFVLIVTQILSIVYFYTETAERPFMDRKALEVLVTTILFLMNVSSIITFVVAYLFEALTVRQRCRRAKLRVLKVVTEKSVIAAALGTVEAVSDGRKRPSALVIESPTLFVTNGMGSQDSGRSSVIDSPSQLLSSPSSQLLIPGIQAEHHSSGIESVAQRSETKPIALPDEESDAFTGDTHNGSRDESTDSNHLYYYYHPAGTSHVISIALRFPCTASRS